MTQYDDKVEFQRLTLEAEEWQRYHEVFIFID